MVCPTNHVTSTGPQEVLWHWSQYLLCPNIGMTSSKIIIWCLWAPKDYSPIDLTLWNRHLQIGEYIFLSVTPPTKWFPSRARAEEKSMVACKMNETLPLFPKSEDCYSSYTSTIAWNICTGRLHCTAVGFVFDSACQAQLCVCPLPNLYFVSLWPCHGEVTVQHNQLYSVNIICVNTTVVLTNGNLV